MPTSTEAATHIGTLRLYIDRPAMNNRDEALEALQALVAEKQHAENVAFRRGYDSGFRQAMSAVKNGVGRELAIHRDAHDADMERLGDA